MSWSFANLLLLQCTMKFDGLVAINRGSKTTPSGTGYPYKWPHTAVVQAEHEQAPCQSSAFTSGTALWIAGVGSPPTELQWQVVWQGGEGFEGNRFGTTTPTEDERKYGWFLARVLRRSFWKVPGRKICRTPVRFALLSETKRIMTEVWIASVALGLTNATHPQTL